MALVKTKDINVAGSNFRCPASWCVEDAENRIRSRFCLTGGGIDADGISLSAKDVIGNYDTCTLEFVDGVKLSQLGRFASGKY